MSIGSAPPLVELHDRGHGIFALAMRPGTGGPELSKELTAELLGALDAARADASIKVLVLSGSGECFLRGSRAQYNEAAPALYRALASFPYPIVAALEGDATGAGFLVAALCDFLVCGETAVCGFTDAQGALFPTAAEHRLLAQRFGEAHANELLYGTPKTGRELAARRWSCATLPSAEVAAHAQKLAENLAQKSQRSLRLLKQHLSRPLAALAEALVPVPLPARDEATDAGLRIAPPNKRLQIDAADGALTLRIRDLGTPYQNKTLVTDLTAVFMRLTEHAANGTAPWRSVVLVSDYPGFLPEQATPADVSSLQRVLLKCALPVIAVLPEGTTAEAWLASQVCDFTVYPPGGAFCAAGLVRSPELARLAAFLFARRFGAAAARDVLLTGSNYSGEELRRRVSLPVAADTLGEAAQLARCWSAWPLDAVVSWKKQAAQEIQDALQQLPAAQAAPALPDIAAIPGAPVRIPLRSKVVGATAHSDGVVVVTMADRDSKNLFSADFVQGMAEVFAHIDSTPAYKAVVLTGYENYFASGGTREALLAIQQGTLKFTDDETYKLGFACRIPVIAAMQGHAIGAGLSLGLFADIALLGAESKYLSPYMGYGFTPGVAATLIVPEKLGHDLAADTLLTAQEYSGSELAARGVALTVLPREQVLDAALRIAQAIARHAREHLVFVKQQLNRTLEERLPDICRQELAMHEQTFVGQETTLQQIRATFDPSVASAAADDAHGTTAHSAEGVAEVVAGIRRQLASELHLDPEELDENTQFMDLGLDSITGVTWIRKVNERYGLSLLATIVYSYPTLTKLGRHIYIESGQRGQAPAQPPASPVISPPAAAESAESPRAAAPVPAPVADETPLAPRDLVSWRKRRTAPNAPESAAPTPAARSRDIAVIGIAGQFPKANDVQEFWSNLAAGRNCISEIPPSRWDVDAVFQSGAPAEGKTNCRYMGQLEQHDRFDPLFFNISPVEAKAMDPQQRVFLQTCWQAIENAAYDPKSLAGSRCGVFVGCGSGEYGLLSRKVQLSAHGFTGGANSILGARIAYYLDLQGPCLSIDTACSSSLVAIANACDSLTDGVSDLALAGGVYVNAGPAMHIMTAQAGMLSADGKCATFDEGANGFVPGEAVGVVMLKRLEDAERDGDIIRAVIRGWGVNQDGRTNGITAPNPESQARLEQFVYRRFGIDPAQIQLIEAHGTGTVLGDPIEIEGLKKSFGAFTHQADYCAVGSVKSNIGHCLAAAGVSGFLKLVLALEARQLPPTIHFNRLNQHIRLDGTPFYVNDRLREWTVTGSSRRHAAVSSFGYSGTNAHVVLAEYLPPATAAAATATPVLVPLSARTAAGLESRCRDLLAFLRREPDADIASIAYTLQVGREAMEERAGFLVSSAPQLAERLEAFLSGRRDIPDAYSGQMRAGKEALSLMREDDEVRDALLDKWIAQRKLSKLLKLWVKGLELDWNRLHGAQKPRRIVLPGYPFALERYWLDEEPAAGAALHPLVQRNTSTLAGQSFSSVLTGPIPADSFLEMARAAVALASDAPARAPDDATRVELRQVVWGEAFTAAESRQVTVDLFELAGGAVGFEIRTDELVYCQGEATVTAQVAVEASQELFFEEYWREQPRGASVPPASDGHARIVRFADAQLAPRPADSQVVRDSADFAAALAEAAGPLSVVYHCAPGRREAGIHSIFALLQAIKRRGGIGALTLVGRLDDSLDSCWDQSWIGFQRSLRLLLPDLAVSILFTGACTEAQLRDARETGGVLWYRGERRFELAVKPADAPPPAGAPTIKQNGAYLITGGCGALGFELARHLAAHYDARLVLLGRSARSADIQQRMDALLRAGAREVHYAAVDVGDAEALRAWAGTLPFALSGVIHAAGVDLGGAFDAKSAPQIDQVLRPKIAGTVLLDEVLRGQPLDFMCYFSSSAAMLGDFGSCDYAVANRFQTAYARYRCVQAGRDQAGRGDAAFAGRTVVINWPFWETQGGMGAKDSAHNDFYLRSSGQDALQSGQGIRIWQDLLHADAAQTLVLTGKPGRIAQFLQRIYLPARAPKAAEPATSRATSPAALPPPRATGASLGDSVRAELRQLVCGALGIDAGRLDDTANLADYGFDSISLTAFAKQISGRFAIDVTPALFFSHSTIAQLVDYFIAGHEPRLRELFGDTGAAPVAPPPAAAPAKLARAPRRQRRPATAAAPEPIAVIGMSGRFPKAASVDAMWTLLAEGRSGIDEIPASRWNWREYQSSTNRGGFIAGVDEFDPLFFEISPAEAEEMDPAERALLMEAYRAIEDARISPAALRGTNVGMFVGMEEGQYGQIADQGITTGGAAMISSRLSYFLDLHGPAIATNTACSSGLVALHQAAMSLRAGECESALVASVALSLAPRAWVKMSEAGMISPDGECFSFANQANGIGIGEAVVVVMLKPLSAALANGDHVYGVIKASGINFDGKTNGVTAPNGRMQAKLIEDTYTRFGIDPDEVSHIVAHGTGTRLGDPVELAALDAAFGALRSARGASDAPRTKCAVTSSKSNFGHTMAASGLVSLAGLLKGLEHARIPASLHCAQENEFIRWSDSHFEINKQTRPWIRRGGRPLVGAVSAFGRSGTNAHVVVEEHRAPAAGSWTTPAVLVVLSARTPEQLGQRARDLLPLADGSLDLAAFAYSLQVTREALGERAAFVVRSAGELAHKLSALAGGDTRDLARGTVGPGTGAIQADTAGRTLEDLARLWVTGAAVDWPKLHERIPARIALPTYPFARERYWVTAPVRERRLRLVSGAAARPPLNTAAIESIIEQVDAGALETRQAVAFLKDVV